MLPFAMPVILAHFGYFKNFYRSYLHLVNQTRCPLLLMLRAEEEQHFMALFYEAFPGAHPWLTAITKQSLIGHMPNALGCYRAMACKIAVSQWFLERGYSHYLAIDADVLVTKHIDNKVIEDIKKGVFHNSSTRVRPHFYEQAATVLGLLYPLNETERFISLCPPFCYDTNVMATAYQRLSRRYFPTGFKWTENEKTPWSNSAPWADPFIYATMRKAMQPNRSIVWADRLTHDPLDGLNPQSFRNFQFSDAYPFTVIHSYTGIAPESIWQKYKKAFPYAD